MFYPSVFHLPARKVSIDEMGAWVDLLEYGCKRGFIPLACANKCHKIGERKIKMGKIALATVFQIDYEKNNIDLKHYTVKDENVKNAEKRFYEYKRLLKLLYQISLKYENIKYQDLIKQIVYPLHEKYGNAYKAIIRSQIQPDIINKLEIPNNIKIHIFEQIEKELNRQKIKIFGLFKANYPIPIKLIFFFITYLQHIILKKKFQMMIFFQVEKNKKKVKN